MTDTTRLSAIIEEELGEFRAFAGLPATEIDAMAQRLTRAIERHLEQETRRLKAA